MSAPSNITSTRIIIDLTSEPDALVRENAVVEQPPTPVRRVVVMPNDHPVIAAVEEIYERQAIHNDPEQGVVVTTHNINPHSQCCERCGLSRALLSTCPLATAQLMMRQRKASRAFLCEGCPADCQIVCTAHDFRDGKSCRQCSVRHKVVSECSPINSRKITHLIHHPLNPVPEHGPRLKAKKCNKVIKALKKRPHVDKRALMHLAHRLRGDRE